MKHQNLNTDLLNLIRGRFTSNFAERLAVQVIESGQVGALYELSICKQIPGLSKIEQMQVNFRAAYALEYIYFHYRDQFSPYQDRFLDDFPGTTNESAKRHFGKMMKDLLQHQLPRAAQRESIAQACIEWLTEPGVRVAVQIRAMEVLLHLKPHVDWLEEVLGELLEPLTRAPSPGMMVHLRRWKKRGVR